MHSASAAAASAASSSASAAAALGAEANAVGSKVAAAPPKPPVAPNPKMGAGAGVSSFFSSACAMTRKAMTGSVQRSELRRREGSGALESARARAIVHVGGKSRHARFSLLYHRAGR